MTRDEVQDAARQAFGGDDLAVDRRDRIVEMGWLTMTVPEAQGGLGLGREAAGVIHSELGRTLVSGATIAQMLVIEALSAADGQERDGLLARAMEGEAMTASLSLGQTLDAVPDADRASHMLSVTPSRITLVPLDDATVTPRDTWDKTRRLFDVDTPGSGIVLAEGEAAVALGDRLQATLLLALAADSLGGAAAILERTIAYLEVRRQFDRPLALFQALKHRVADMKTRLSAAEALFWQRVADPGAALIEIGALKVHACTVYRDIAEEAIQLHGGVGLTMEYYCHLFLKRATLNAVLGGDADHWEEQAGRRLLQAG